MLCRVLESAPKAEYVLDASFWWCWPQPPTVLWRKKSRAPNGAVSECGIAKEPWKWIMNVHTAFGSIDPRGSGCHRTCTTIHFDRFQQSIPRRPRETMFTSSLCALVELDSLVCYRTWQRKILIELISIKSRENLNSRKNWEHNCHDVLIIML